MEQNNRPRSQATHTRRLIHYGRAESSHSQPMPTPVEQQYIAQEPAGKEISLDLHLGMPKFIKNTYRKVVGLKRYSKAFKSFRVRVSLVVIAVVIALSQVIPFLESSLIQHTYAMGESESLLQPKSSTLASKLVENKQTGSYDFNAGYSPMNATTDSASGGPVITAEINKDPAKGLKVTDPLSGSSFTMKPQFRLLPGKQDGNRVVYPLMDGTGWVVYTMQATSVKEDVILDRANGDTMKLKYDLDLEENGLEAVMSPDGSVEIYGSSTAIGGNVATGSEKDAELLQKARKNAKKDKYLFSLPTPVVYQDSGAVSKQVKTRYELKGEYLTAVTTGLKGASYPLDIDPAVTVIGTADLFRDTNPDSNVDLDASTGSIIRGKVTGGVVTTNWTSNANNLGTSRWLHGSAVYDDYAYVAGGAGGGSQNNISSVEFASVSKVNQSIGTWATTTSLPTATSRFQLLIYNGYMYALGGSTSTTTCATTTNKIYFNRIQNNGQLSANWTDNSTLASPGGSNLPASLCGFGAAIFNNKLYIVGGRTSNTVASASTGVYYASINPDGSIGSFTTEDSVLTASRYDADLEVYNGYLYYIGGTLSSGALTNTVQIATLAADGSIYGTTAAASWKSGTNLTTARSAMGGSLATLNDGFMYVQGGCNTLNTSTQVCSTLKDDIEVAQINADGTIGNWSSISTTIASYSQVGGSLQFWRGTIYTLGGCTAISATAAQCTTVTNLQKYDSIATPGQLGPLKTAANTMPATTFAHGVAINNGYIYIVGGCITNNCQSGTNDTSGNTSYAPINADGSIGTWTTDSTNLLNAAAFAGDVGLAAFGMTVYNNFLYVVGGYTDGGPTSNTYYVGLNASTGALTGAWTIGTAMGANRYYNSVIAYHGFLFSFGGCTGTTGSAGCSSYFVNSYRWIINANGSLGARTDGASTGNFRNFATGDGKALMGTAFYNGYVYLTNGAGTNEGGQSSTIRYAQIQSNGNITGWNVASGETTTSQTGLTALNLRRTDAYAMNGYLYISGGHDGTAGQVQTYGTIEIGKINLSTGDVTGPSGSGNLLPSVISITPRWDSRVAFSNGYIYDTGGCEVGDPPASCSTRSNRVEYVEIYNAGNKGTSTWSNASNTYSTNRAGGATVAYNGYLYVAGGCQAYTVGASFGNTTTQCTTPGTNNLNTVSYAAINPDGSLGVWANSSNNLTASNARAFGCLVTAGGYLYYIGGADNTGAATATVLYSQIGAAGAPGTWAQASNGLTAARRNLSCNTFNGHIYATGGVNGSNTDVTTVDYSPDLSSGGNIGSSWTAFGTGFTTARANHSSVIAGGYLYILGGDDATNALNDVQYIQLVPSGGSTGSWGYSVDLPNKMSYQTAIAANGYIYLFGGRTTATNCLNNTYIASINSTGKTSDWSQGVNNFSTARFGASGDFYNGYYYVMGGNTCSAMVTSNVIQYGGEQSQAMKTIFSKYADLNGDGQPQKLVIYLTNAKNNGVDIEEWKMSYISSREAAVSYGQARVITPLVTENAYSVVAYDGSGVDQKVARWYYLQFSIDMYQSFNFHDTNQPTVYQYGLHYSPPPSKRLMHGRDFRDQTQQGEDLKL